MKILPILAIVCASFSTYGGAKARDIKEEPVLPYVLAAPNNFEVETSKHDDNESYPYYGVHVQPIPLPVLGVDLGYRHKATNCAVDVNLKYTSAFIANAIEIDAMVLKYFDSFYLGCGMRSCCHRVKEHTSYTSGLIFASGFEFTHEDRKPTFVELDILYPTYVYKTNVICLYPTISIKYGWGF